MCIDSSVVEEIRITHNLSHEIFSGDDFSLMSNDVFEELKFRFSEEGLAISSDDLEIRFDETEISIYETFFTCLRCTAS